MLRRRQKYLVSVGNLTRSFGRIGNILVFTPTELSRPLQYEGCLEIIQPFWISRKPVAWPGCNLASSQKRTYCVSVKSPCRGASQSAVRRRWMGLCSVWLLHSQISCLLTANLDLWKARIRRIPNLGCRGLTSVGDIMLCQKSLHESCRMGRRIVVMELICSLGHCECDGHTVYKLSQWRLTADWLAPPESDCSRMDSKFSSDWLLSYIKATRLV